MDAVRFEFLLMAAIGRDELVKFDLFDLWMAHSSVRILGMGYSC